MAKTKEDRRAARLRNRTLRKQKDESLEKELLEETEIEAEPSDNPEPIEKDYYDSPMMVMPGPTSWEEQEALQAAREKADHIRHVTYTTQDLVNNILYGDMTPEEKTKAIKAVGDGMGKKLKEVDGDKKMEKELDMDLLQLQAIAAIDSRHTSVVEKTMDLLEKTFKKPDAHSKWFMRQVVKDTISWIEKGEIDQPGKLSRENIPALIKSAKDLGVGVSNTMLIEKDKTGSWRAILFPTNNFRDRDGEIVSEAAHQEYVEWVNKNMDCAPVFATWHKPGTARTNPMDFVGYEHGIMITSLPLTEPEAARLLKMQAQVDIGLSIGGVALERDGSDIITKYRMFEVSDLPLERAANPFTELQLISKEAQMDMKKYLSEMLGDDKRAEDILGKMALTQKQLREANVEEKEVKTDSPATDTKTEPQTTEAIPMDSIVTQVLERVSKELDMEGLSDYLTKLKEDAEKVPVLEALVKELAASNDDKLAELLDPPATKTLVWKRASQSKDTVLKKGNEEDDKLEKASPKLGWLSEATGTKPVEV